MAKLPKEWFFDPADPKQAPKLKEIDTLSKTINHGFKMIAEVMEELMQTNPESAKKLALGLAAVTSKENFIKLATKAEKARSGNAIEIQKQKAKTTSERDELIYQEYLSEFLPKGRMSGYALKLSQRWTQKTSEYISPKRIANIVSAQKKKSKIR